MIGDRHSRVLKYLPYGIISIPFVLISSAILILVLFLADTSVNPYGYKFEWPLVLSAALAVCLLFLIVFACTRWKRVLTGRFGISLTIASAMLLIAQILIVISIAYENTWDPGTILAYAQAVAAHQDLSPWEWYYDLFPNNYFLTYILVCLCKVANVIGIEPVVFAGCIGATLVNAGGAMSAITTKRITKSIPLAWVTWFTYTFLGSLSLWISVPYSDAYGTFFIAAIPFVVTSFSRKRTYFFNTGLGMALGLVISFGAAIKPTVYIAAIALLAAFAIGLISRNVRIDAAVASSILGAIAAFGLSFFLIIPSANASVGVIGNTEKQITMTHYLMMGANKQYYGYFSFEDYAISREAETISERQERNLSEYRKRMEAFGALGYAVFLLKKTIITYDDGTFGVGGEGQPLPPDNQHLMDNPLGDFSLFLRDLYYFNSDFHALKELEQVVWLMALISIPFAFGYYRFTQRSETRRKLTILLLMASFVGMFLFLMLFETRSRYLYLYLPVFSILETLGIGYFEIQFQKLKKWFSSKDVKLDNRRQQQEVERY